VKAKANGAVLSGRQGEPGPRSCGLELDEEGSFAGSRPTRSDTNVHPARSHATNPGGELHLAPLDLTEPDEESRLARVDRTNPGEELPLPRVGRTNPREETPFAAVVATLGGGVKIEPK
jgi:hypothetical protein